MQEKLDLPKVIAHRGASGYAPENTFAAMKKAKELGIDWVEFDVMLAGCGEAIVIHDDRLNRTTSGKGKVAKIPYTEIRQLDAGSWYAPEFSSERVPTLQAMIEFLSQWELHANVEIKPSPHQDRVTAQKTVMIIREHWPTNLSFPLVSSFSVESLVAARSADESLALGLLLGKWRKDWQHVASDLRCVSIHVKQKLLNPKRVAEIKNAGYQLLAYTVNDLANARELWSWGVDTVFSDYPDKLLMRVRM